MVAIDPAKKEGFSWRRRDAGGFWNRNKSQKSRLEACATTDASNSNEKKPRKY
jgi:hypothetical protein